MECPGVSAEVRLEVSVAATGEKVYSGSSLSSSLLVKDLVPSTSYTLKLWAVNSLGTSQPNYIR